MRARESEEDMRKKCVLDTDTKFVFVFFGTFSAKKFETHKKLPLLLLLLVPAKERRNPKKKNRATCSLASASFTPKKTQKNRRKRRERAILPSERER